MTVGAVLFSEMTPQPAWEAEFNAWYDEEHIPIRMQSPGFLGAQRYRDTASPSYLAVYDMDAPAALNTPEYVKIKTQPSEQTARMLRDVTGFTRYIGHLTSWQVQDGVDDATLLTAPVLYPVMFRVPEDREAEFDAWYTEEHVPLLLGADGWLGCRRYKLTVQDPEPWTHLALHHLRDASVLDAPERAAARQTDWRARLAAEDWFRGSYKVFPRHGGRFQGVGA
jgi:hypothetical protein